jgi:preprotein translocase subunit YajC
MLEFIDGLGKIVVCILLTLGFIAIINQAKQNQKRRKWAREIGAGE